MFRKNVVEKIGTHILRSMTSFLENRSFYEIMWKNVVEPDRPQTIYQGTCSLHAS